MAKFLKDLLGSREPLFALTLQQLEAMTGRQGIDIAYMADITARAHATMRQLGLDTADTTVNELHNALAGRADDGSLFGNTSDVGLLFDDAHIVSFNQDDVKENRQLPLEQRTARHMQCRLQLGLIERYKAAASDPEAVTRLAHQAKLDVCDLDDYHAGQPEQQAASAPRILCIGDIFTDVFIKLLENEARIDKDPDGSERLSVPFGSKPPYERADVVTSVGPSPNAAVSIARLGAQVSLMSWLGDDRVGKDSLNYLASENIDTTPTVVEKGILSNTYYVLRYGADRTILVKNEAYSYAWQEPTVKPDWVYLSLLSGDSWPLHEALATYLESNPDIKFAFQPGTFHFKWGAEKLARLYGRTEVVVMNREEAVDVTGKSYDSLKDLADGLHALGPKYVVITDGAKGSYASYDGRLVTIPNYPDPAPPVDRTGAGDAFASTIVAALALGESMDTALQWAPINSMNVVQKLGAQAGLLHREQVAEYLSSAPEDYYVKEFVG